MRARVQIVVSPATGRRSSAYIPGPGDIDIYGPMAVWLRGWRRDRRIADSNPENTEFLTNMLWTSYTIALVSLFTKHAKLIN